MYHSSRPSYRCRIELRSSYFLGMLKGASSIWSPDETPQWQSCNGDGAWKERSEAAPPARDQPRFAASFDQRCSGRPQIEKRHPLTAVIVSSSFEEKLIFLTCLRRAFRFHSFIRLFRKFLGRAQLFNRRLQLKSYGHVQRFFAMSYTNVSTSKISVNWRERFEILLVFRLCRPTLSKGWKK